MECGVKMLDAWIDILLVFLGVFRKAQERRRFFMRIAVLSCSGEFWFRLMVVGVRDSLIDTRPIAGDFLLLLLGVSYLEKLLSAIVLRGHDGVLRLDFAADRDNLLAE